MKLVVAFLLLAAAVASPDIRYFRYQRPLQNAPQHPAQTCLAIDAGLFAHAAPQLADLRLYRGQMETPYVIYRSVPIQTAEQFVAPLNLGLRKGQTTFDASIPDGSYTDLKLAVTRQNFIATVMISGSQTQTGAATKLGSYTIFDLARQRLGRSTVLHLPGSDFRYLHFRIVGTLSPESITGISVVRLPVGQPKLVTVAESSHPRLKGHSSVFEFTVPAHVPVDRIVLAPGSEPASFSRDVRVTVVPSVQRSARNAVEPPQPARSYGNFLRVHSVQDGHRIDEERLAIDAPKSDLDTAAMWTVSINNGDDAPLQINSVRLEMLERDLCFEAAAATRYVLFYGDPALTAPNYDYATLFKRQSNATQATAGPEQLNPQYQSRPDERPFTEKHPALLWLVLALVIVMLGAIALRSAKLTRQAPQ